MEAGDRTAEMSASRRVDPYEVVWRWVTHSPSFFWTRGKLARALEYEHPGEGSSFRFAIANMVATGVLTETRRPGSQRKRERLVAGNGLLARAREREIAIVAAKLRRETELKAAKSKGRSGRVVQW